MIERFVGDEFGITLVDLEPDADIEGIVRLLIGAFAEPFLTVNQEVFLVPSVGISIFPDDTKDYDELARFADTAVHSAKRHGGASYQFYKASMHVDTDDRLSMENALRRALEREEFQLYYQPQLSLESRKIIGVEALLRWQRDGGEMMLPAKFIPLLEETSLIVSVGEWILRQACADHRDWKDKGHGSIPISVNLSARQFRDQGLVEMIRRVLKESSTDPRMIELEITESCVMEDPEVALHILQEW